MVWKRNKHFSQNCLLITPVQFWPSHDTNEKAKETLLSNQRNQGAYFLKANKHGQNCEE